MGKCSFSVNLSPQDALNMIKDDLNADLVHEEDNTVDGKSIGIQVYEKYYMRAGNKVALTVIVEDFTGLTNVRAIGTAGSRDFIFNFDLGASDDFAERVAEILNRHIIERYE